MTREALIFERIKGMRNLHCAHLPNYGFNIYWELMYAPQFYWSGLIGYEKMKKIQLASIRWAKRSEGK